MKFIVYQTTNLVNGKIYIGRHKTSDLADGYYGSGRCIRAAVQKYGIANFKTDVLFKFATEAEAEAKEAELVTEEFVSREDTYNLCPGGRGGWGYINLDRKDPDSQIERARAAKIRETVVRKEMWRNLPRTTSDMAKKAHATAKERGTGIYCETQKMRLQQAAQTVVARKKRKETFAEISHQRGEKNSQFGTMWVTDGKQNKKIKKTDIVPDGWNKGRFLPGSSNR